MLFFSSDTTDLTTLQPGSTITPRPILGRRSALWGREGAAWEFALMTASFIALEAMTEPRACPRWKDMIP